MTGPGPADWVEVGRITGAYGVRGWLRLVSYTAVPDAVLTYQPWQFRQSGRTLVPTVMEVRPQGRGFVMRIAECTSREDAEGWRGAVLVVPAEALPKLGPGEYYWAQLIGLAVETQEGRRLGTITRMFETGANDVVVIEGERERLLPYIPSVIREVDLAGRRMVVDWDPEF